MKVGCDGGEERKGLGEESSWYGTTIKEVNIHYYCNSTNLIQLLFIHPQILYSSLHIKIGQ